MDPLTVANNIITIYSAVRYLRRVRESYHNVPEIISVLQQEVNHTLEIFFHMQRLIDEDERHRAGEITNSPSTINQQLDQAIAGLYPQVESLRDELQAIISTPETNFDNIVLTIARTRLPRLRSLHKAISERLTHFDRLVAQWTA